MMFPPEWSAAYKSARLLNDFINTHEVRAVFGRCVIDGVLIFVVLVIVCCTPFELGDAFIKSILMVMGILTGFVINALMFTGRDGDTSSLTFEQTQEYAQKIKYLIWTQIGTLKAYITCIFFALITLAVGTKETGAISDFLTMSLLWFLIYGLIRTLLLPFQIYDLHAFNLEQAEIQKMNEANKAVEDLD